mmetsp:Transcript_25129/g.70977  ORF Transcript_25129/g.70977 Transcript_25129/m.70977 type:complete len:299 (-) Transcript_25129:125-1021(-)
MTRPRTARLRTARPRPVARHRPPSAPEPTGQVELRSAPSSSSPSGSAASTTLRRRPISPSSPSRAPGSSGACSSAPKRSASRAFPPWPSSKTCAHSAPTWTASPRSSSRRTFAAPAASRSCAATRALSRSCTTWVSAACRSTPLLQTEWIPPTSPHWPPSSSRPSSASLAWSGSCSAMRRPSRSGSTSSAMALPPMLASSSTTRWAPGCSARPSPARPPSMARRADTPAASAPPTCARRSRPFRLPLGRPSRTRPSTVARGWTWSRLFVGPKRTAPTIFPWKRSGLSWRLSKRQLKTA